MARADVSICLIAFRNDLHNIRRCLESYAAHRPATVNVEWVVSENLSDDGTVEYLESLAIDRVKIIRSENALTFAQNSNVCISQSSGRYILLLNADTIFVEDVITPLFEFMEEHTQVGIATCRLTYENGDFQINGRRFFRWRHLIACKLGTIEPLRWVRRLRIYQKAMADYYQVDESVNEVKEVDCVIGAFLMTRREVVDSIGMLDERFLHYSEDTDFCYRVKLGGWKNVYYPHCRIIHLYNRSSMRGVINRDFLLAVYTAVVFHAKHYWKLIK